MDREYAVCFYGKNGLDELDTGAKNLTAAKRVAMEYYKNGASKITVKMYDEGDLRHQWDLSDDGKKWTQYE